MSNFMVLFAIFRKQCWHPKHFGDFCDCGLIVDCIIVYVYKPYVVCNYFLFKRFVIKDLGCGKCGRDNTPFITHVFI